MISYSPIDKGYGGVCSLAPYPRKVKLFLGRGAQLSKSDPSRLLQGLGKTVRHVVLSSVADFERPEIEVLIAAALKLAKVRLDASAKGGVILVRERAGEEPGGLGRDSTLPAHQLVHALD